MSDLWLASYILLWALVVVLLVADLMLIRLTGLLYRRFPPYGARGSAEGVAIGSRVAPFEETDIAGQRVQLPHRANGRPTMLIFLSPNCGACAELAPAIRSIWRSDRRDVNVLLVGTAGTGVDAQAFAREHRLSGIPFVVAPEWAATSRIMGTPYVMVVDAENVVRAKGVANHLEHLDSLLRHLERDQEVPATTSSSAT